MIRRDAQAADGSPRWILIPQIDHARLAGDLADAWHFGRAVEPIAADIRHAARHHDDGWADWDLAPGVDASGVPVNFDAMRLADALSIWQRGIELSTIHSPLAGYLTAGHFCRLLARFDSSRARAANRPLGERFLADQAANMDALLAAWQSADQPARTRPLAELGVSLVQLFDAASLWFCCAPRHQPWEARLPEGPQWTFTPRAGSNTSAEAVPAAQVSLEPWPLDRQSLTLRAAGRSVPAARYRGAEELAAMPGEPVELVWRLALRT